MRYDTKRDISPSTSRCSYSDTVDVTLSHLLPTVISTYARRGA